MKSNLNDPVVDEFLNSQTKSGTFKSYKTVMNMGAVIPVTVK